MDTQWRRTSYSALSAPADAGPGVGTEAEVAPDDDGLLPDDQGADAVPSDVPPRDELPGPWIPGSEVASPMAGLPVGATFGSLVHAVLEHTDPASPDRHQALLDSIEAQAHFWPAGLAPEQYDELADALEAVYDSPLGPLAGNVSLGSITVADRLAELDFEFPLAGGDSPSAHNGDLLLSDLAPILEEHLAEGDPVREWARTLRGAPWGAQPLRGYLTGSIDVVLRVGETYLVVDYKTNWLGPFDEPLTASAYDPSALAAAMGHSSYPLQAILYAVVAHRFLRGRLRDYEPDRHLGGVLYLYLRGMWPRDSSHRRASLWSVLLVATVRDGVSHFRPLGRGPAMSISPTNPIDQLSEFDARRARDATGVLAELNAAGVLHAGDVHLAQTLAKSTEPSPARPMEQRELVELAIALTARGLREGSICVDLEVEVEALAESHPIGWPDSQEWLKVLQSDEVTRAGALVIDDGLVYLQRFHHQEVSLAESLAHRAALPPLPFDAEALGEAAAWVFPPDASYDAQRNAALTAVAARTSVLTGGPGTGKTTAIAGLLALLWINAQASPSDTGAATKPTPRRLRIALAAPTAKAALRLKRPFTPRSLESLSAPVNTLQTWWKSPKSGVR
ncbi:AAA family ATPase [Ornithinimicrobium sp. INDO-MA30-4]|uniref:AAA family ATPase n=1 Tax=Ornithinimicrobium sp. INDO-MA30-4 TaxID=2908651 RepID=UPI0021A75401|nr:AAA family ATPase [Ornithinimicrobium sp. INDO-MA30-4]